jgi:hypothetical protein
MYHGCPCEINKSSFFILHAGAIVPSLVPLKPFHSYMLTSSREHLFPYGPLSQSFLLSFSRLQAMITVFPIHHYSEINRTYYCFTSIMIGLPSSVTLSVTLIRIAFVNVLFSKVRLQYMTPLEAQATDSFTTRTLAPTTNVRSPTILPLSFKFHFYSTSKTRSTLGSNLIP